MYPICWLFQSFVPGPGPRTNYKVWALGRFSGLAGRAESCPLLGAALAVLGGAVAHLLGATSGMDVWICPGAGGVGAQVGGSSLGEMYEFSHARAGRAGLWGGLQQSKGKKERRAEQGQSSCQGAGDVRKYILGRQARRWPWGGSQK